jgi:hypothetical protein
MEGAPTFWRQKLVPAQDDVGAQNALKASGFQHPCSTGDCAVTRKETAMHSLAQCAPALSKVVSALSGVGFDNPGLSHVACRFASNSKVLLESSGAGKR